ncbi:MAG: orotate phosphoribosyltransferase [Oscillospiraceae bacterium]|nr:orotate phosphoribosyltransferase [Oscillospiraceae bacterium]
MENRMRKIQSSTNRRLMLKAIPGHFATNHSHSNYYVDMSTLKSRQNEASAVAFELANRVMNTTIVDTVLCLDGTEVVGAYLAEELCRSGVQIMNTHGTIYIVSPEYSGGQMIVRDNIMPMIQNKNVLLLSATISSGISCQKSIESIEYYGGRVSAVAAIFSSITECAGHPVYSVFGKDVLPDYQTFAPHQCPHCQRREKLDALVNAYGYSKL